MGPKWRERERDKDRRAREADSSPQKKRKFNPIVWDLDDSKTTGSVSHQASTSQSQAAGPPHLSTSRFGPNPSCRFGPNPPNSPASLKPSPPNNEADANASSSSPAAMGVGLRGKGYTVSGTVSPSIVACVLMGKHSSFSPSDTSVQIDRSSERAPQAAVVVNGKMTKYSPLSSSAWPSDEERGRDLPSGDVHMQDVRRENNNGTPDYSEDALEPGQILDSPIMLQANIQEQEYGGGTPAPIITTIARSRWAEADPHSPEQNSSLSLRAPRVHEDMELESEPEDEPMGNGLEHYRAIDRLKGCRSVDEYEKLNQIAEGTYGVVYRARDKKTGELVALKKVKMEHEKSGFPMTALREINILLSLHHHPSVVDVKEVVVGNMLDDIFMVMEYMEHDLKSSMDSTMKQQPFSQSEVKCLMLQLLDGVNYLHDNWVLHRDLKTPNLLLNNRGELKICDFGLARQYGDPLKEYSHEVVTLWYRAPELLLGARKYSTAIDMWSCGCIMAELLSKEPLFPGKSVLDEIDKIFRILGTPNEKIWPDFVKLPGVLRCRFKKQPFNKLKEKFPAMAFGGRPTLSHKGFDLLNRLLTYDPLKRITAQEALNHEWFREVPLPKAKEFMPTFPARSNGHDRIRIRRLLNP